MQGALHRQRDTQGRQEAGQRRREKIYDRACAHQAEARREETEEIISGGQYHRFGEYRTIQIMFQNRYTYRPQKYSHLKAYYSADCWI